MNPREAERLLGGYATGTLAESERSALFAAALEDQALFDALADEEALRELLADPAARAKLLAALEPKAVPFWRRPGAVTLAASLVAAVGVGILLKHMKPEQALPQPPALLEAPSGPAQAPAAASVPPPPPAALPAAKTAPQEYRRMKKAPEAPPAPAPALISAPAAAPVPPPAPEPGRSEVVVTGAASVADAAPHAKAAEAGMNLSAERLAALPPAPTWSWSGSGNAHRLTVRWGRGGFLYLVRRDPAGDRLVAPLRVDRAPDGSNQSVFAAPERDAAPLDLYVSPVPLASFAPDGSVKPLRVWPEKK